MYYFINHPIFRNKICAFLHTNGLSLLARKYTKFLVFLDQTKNKLLNKWLDFNGIRLCNVKPRKHMRLINYKLK